MSEFVPLKDRPKVEREYWGGYFGEKLRPQIGCTTQYRTVDGIRVPRAYFSPKLFVYDRRKGRVNAIARSFSGKVGINEVGSKGGFFPKGVERHPGYFWCVSGVENALPILEGIQSEIISQKEVVDIMLEYLYSKLCDEDDTASREEKGKQFRSRLHEARPRRFQTLAELTPAKLAGALDATALPAIKRGLQAEGRVTFNPSIDIHSDNRLFVDTMVNEYKEHKDEKNDEEDFSEEGVEGKYHCRFVRPSEIARILTPEVVSNLKFLKEPAKFLLRFIELQNLMAGGSMHRGRHLRSGELAEVLIKYSPPGIDLVSLLREGFYSRLHVINHQLD